MSTWIVNLIILVSGSTAYANYIEQRLDLEQSPINNNQSSMLDKTKDALMSFDYIEDRADYFVFKLKNLTFGEYSEDLMYIAPAITGSVEIRAYNMNVYYNHFQNSGGIKYKMKF